MRKIGLTQRVEFLTDRNEWRDCLDQSWAALLLDNGFLPIPLPNRAADAGALVRELGLDGAVLTGGNDLAHLPGAANTAPERDVFERKLLKVCTECAIPVLGVCRGLQMMVVHGGGKLVPVAGHVATNHPIAVHPCDGFPLTGREIVNSYHGHGVPAGGLGFDWQVAATAPDGSVEAVAHRHRPQWGVMWHPERPPHDPCDAALLCALFGRETG